MPLDSRYEFLLVLMFLGVAFLLFPDMVVACARAPKPTVLQAYNDSDVVVIARAISVEKLSDESQKPMTGTLVTSTTMEVEKVYKGNLRVGDTMVFGQGNGIRCTWVFYESDISKEYLFYLNSPSRDQKLWYEYGLGRSNLRQNAADDLLYLNKMDKVHGRTRISGVLAEDGLAGLSVEGQTIRIIGRNKTYVTKTDKNGVYELYDVPPGRYVLAPELKFGWKVDEFSLTRPFTRVELMHGRRQSNRVAFTLRPRSHFGVDLKLTLSNHVGGSIYDSNSKPMPGFCSIARQWLLTRNANQIPFTGIQRLTDRLHVLKSLIVRSAKPQTIDVWCGDHFFNGIEGRRISDAQFTRERCRCCCVVRIWAIDTEDVCVANSAPGLQVKFCDKTATDESNA